MIYIYYHPLDQMTDSAELTIRGLRQYLRDLGAYHSQEKDLIPGQDKNQDRIQDLSSLVPGNVEIHRDSPQGKPYFKEYPQICHNVSHSGAWWVCAYGSAELGLDLQKIEEKGRKRVDKIARRFFHIDEVTWLQGQAEEEFYRLWAYNESYVKYKGVGLTRGLDAFSTVRFIDGHAEPLLGADGVCQQEIPFVEGGYYMVLTSREKEEVCLRALS